MDRFENAMQVVIGICVTIVLITMAAWFTLQVYKDFIAVT